jgi:Xaa-Pro aminopeptidase
MKKITNNFQCINIASECYTGKEQSPKGLGYSAVTYNIGFEKEGVDKQLWSVQMKNNKKVWFRKSGMPQVTHEEPIITDINQNKEIIEEEKPNIVNEIKEEEPKQKKTDFNLFYKYYSNKLKEENIQKGLNKKPKVIQEESYTEWNRLKKNKEELNELLLLIKSNNK